MKKDKVFIIAEAGVNHNGDMRIARELIDVAVKAGADAIKFQSFKAERLLCKTTEKANYQKQTTDKEESQFEMIKKLELSAEDHIGLISYCEEKGITFLSTPFDIESAQSLYDLGLRTFKIPSGEINHYPYLKKIASFGVEIILSTGMSRLEEVEDALKVLEHSGTPRSQIRVLHANTEYPTEMVDVNLRAMNTIAEKCDVRVGYSDHTLGIEVATAAVALGACVIEKHFTLDRSFLGPDHQASLVPKELSDLVQAVRNIELALGISDKVVSKSEAKNLPIARKSIVAKRFIEKGELFSEENLCCKRPGIGINPMKWNDYIGKVANKNYFEDDLIQEI